MNSFLVFLLRAAISIPIGGLIWLISFFAFDLSLLSSFGTSLLCTALSFWLIKEILLYRFLKEQGLSRREYKYIEKNLKEAKEKLRRLNRALFSLRQLSSLKQNTEIFRIARKIYTITKNEPRRFYLAEKFYFYHLDSFVELAEKHAFLSAQPTKNVQIESSLKEARMMLNEMRHSLEKDLEQILAKDIHDLQFEIDVVKHRIDNGNKLDNFDGTRRLK